MADTASNNAHVTQQVPHFSNTFPQWSPQVLPGRLPHHRFVSASTVQALGVVPRLRLHIASVKFRVTLYYFPPFPMTTCACSLRPRLLLSRYTPFIPHCVMQAEQSPNSITALRSGIKSEYYQCPHTATRARTHYSMVKRSTSSGGSSVQWSNWLILPEKTRRRSGARLWSMSQAGQI